MNCVVGGTGPVKPRQTSGSFAWKALIPTSGLYLKKDERGEVLLA